MQLGFVMQADAAPHDDGACGPTWWTITEAAAPFGGILSPLTLATCLELARFLEMSPASVAPVAARLEKKRTPNFTKTHHVTPTRWPRLGRTPAHPTTRRRCRGVATFLILVELRETAAKRIY